MRFEDLTGRIFSNLKVIERDLSKKKTAWFCECLCCGKIVSVFAYNLKNGNSTNCGCIRNQKAGDCNFKNLVGETFGSLFVKERTASKSGHAYFLCECLECGNITEVSGTNLLTGKTVSCGCVRKRNIEDGREQVLQEAKVLKTNIGRIKSNKPMKTSSTGIRGVYKCKSRDYYVAKIGFQGKIYVLKTSKDIKKCILARKEAEEKIFGEFLKWYESQKKKHNEE